MAQRWQAWMTAWQDYRSEADEYRELDEGRILVLMRHGGRGKTSAKCSAALAKSSHVNPTAWKTQSPISPTRSPNCRPRNQVVPVSALTQNNGAVVGVGKLSFIDNAVDATTGTITLKALFPNQNRTLWPGQFVTVAVTLQQRPNAVVVPSQAVQTGQRGQYVYVVKEDRSVEMRPVKVGESVDQQSIIDSGVAPGETVVTDGQIRLTPKSHVEVKNAL